jgi:hypothetical protein
MRYFYFAILTAFSLSACQKPTPQVAAIDRVEVSLSSELKTFYDISTLPAYLTNTVSAQVSTYDTTWKNNDGFSGAYSFVRRNADSSLVIFDVEGSGVINRIWTPTPTEDTLDFFIDSDNRPSFSVKYADLFSGKQFPFVAPLCGNQLGGFYCYLPIPFARSCKIVSRGKRMQFHQIQYRTYPEKYAVKSFAIDLASEEKAALGKIDSLWHRDKISVTDFYPQKLLASASTVEIGPGETKTVFEMNEGGRLLGFELDPSGIFEGIDKRIDIRISWDDEKDPAVFCPVADFFGYAFGSASMQSLLLGSEGSRNYCFFPMPFDRRAKIELVYRDYAGAQPVNVNTNVWYTNEQRMPEKEGKFYTYWSKNIRATRGEPHVFLTTKGKGHYVGTVLQAQGLKAGMTLFFEGDDSTAIDGMFRMHGTGSEDYFNGGWYALMDRWDGKMSLPLHGALDYSLPFCRTGGYRLFLSDKLSFEKSIFHSMEHGPVGNAFPVDYTSVAFFYADTPSKKTAAPTAESARVFLPDTLIIYPQLMKYGLEGNVGLSTTWQYGTGGLTFRLEVDDESLIRISLADIPESGYRLLLDVVKQDHGCDFSVWQRQTQISGWMTTQQKSEERVKDIYLCDIDVRKFKDTITIRFRTEGARKKFFLNRMVLIRK